MDWQEYILSGFRMLLLVGIIRESFDLGFDALAPSNLWHAEELCKGRWCKLLQHKIRQLFPNYTPLDKYKYKDIISNFYTSYDYREDVYPSIIPNWDRSPRAGRRAVIYTGSTPALLKNI